jgi:hypothetical protein
VAATHLISNRWRSLGRVCLLGLAASLALSCGDHTDNITVQPLPTAPNEPPTIVDQGPDWDSTPIDLSVQRPPQPYVIAADPNGAGDLATAVLTIDSAIIHRIVVRPDSVLPAPYCDDIAWTDSTDITSLLPASFSKVVEDCPMSRSATSFSYFYYAGFGWTPYSETCLAFPPIATASPYFGPPVKSCGPSYPLLRFGIYPPGVPSAIDVNVTFLDVEYRDIHATVYDGRGLKATATFPPLRLIYRAYGEKRSPP